MAETRLPLRALIGLWAVASLMLIVFAWPHIAMGDGWDPDDRLRLVQLRDWMGGQGWLDTTQYRLNPPDGGPMHWNRLIEIPLAMIVWPLAPLVGQAMAEQIAGVLVPLAGLGLVMLSAARIAIRISPQDRARPAAIAAAGLTIGASALLIQFLPMRIDHHGWQIVLAMLALAALSGRNDARHGIAIGLALALWLSISLEGLPLALGFFAAMGLVWLFRAEADPRLSAALASFAIATPLLYLATRGFAPPGGCDIIGPAHIGAIAAASLVLAPMTARPATGLAARILTGIAAMAAGTAALLLIDPACASDGFGALDPLVHNYWYENVREGLPVWRQYPGQALSYGAGPVLGLIAFLVLIRQPAHPERRRMILMAGLVLAWSVLVALLVFRAVSTANAIAIPFQAWLAVHLYDKARTLSRPALRVLAIWALVPVVLPGMVLGNIARLASTPAQSTGGANLANARCDTSTNLATLAALPRARILAPFDLGPGILMTTGHSVLASSHHRNAAAMHDQIVIFRSAPKAAHRLIRRHAIAYVVLCPGEPEMRIYARRDPDGLGAMLTKGSHPGWLDPVDLPGSELRIWKVLP
ncbi:MAG: hypothetical protein R3E02_12465 [Blastomonas sp.]